MTYHPYKPDASGYTALHRFAKRRDEAVVTLLLAMYDGKAIDLASVKSFKQQQIALHVAAKNANHEGLVVGLESRLCRLGVPRARLPARSQ
ncbi:hypothetical protein PR003_g7998 [Phytophthora rubi]|uniref:Uncharacterized protein n=1 Tax=Phytophthora rubi TaxID=129364 RepID=A0A6A3N474_9STRA|nr:hypothetical protein PR002_g6014 [Phytophthora rubi]KAE9345335.1 hypothetical protein PR003_g7998 [Phytophthora rubi]